MTETQSLAPAKEGKDIRSLIASDKVKQQLAAALPSHMSADRFARVVLTALTRTPKLLDCTPQSLLRSMMDCSQLGLEPDGRHAHLIPYDNRKLGVTECQLIIDYKGLIALAKRGGDIVDIGAVLVCEKDVFEWENGKISHKINFREARGKAQCVYSFVEFKGGDRLYDIPMTLEEVDAVRRKSRAANAGPWVTDFEEMVKKTAIRRHSKRLTLSPEFMDALDRDFDKLDERVVKGREVPAAEVPRLFGQFSAAPVSSGAGETTAEKEPGEPLGAASPATAEFWSKCNERGWGDLEVMSVLRAQEMTDAEFPGDLSDYEAKACLDKKAFAALEREMGRGAK